MTRVPTSPPAPPLRDFLDEVVVPLLVERFLRERAAADPRDSWLWAAPVVTLGLAAAGRREASAQLGRER